MVKFNLHNRSEKETSIKLIYFRRGKRFKWATGQKIAPKHWDDKKQRVKTRVRGSKSINDFLDRCALIVQQVVQEFRMNGDFATNQILRKALDEQTAKVSTEEVSILEYMRGWIDRRKGTGDYAAGTIKRYNRDLNNLERFFKTKRFYTWEEIDLEMLQLMKNYFIVKKGHKTSYLNKIVQQLKMVMDEAYERGIHKNLSYTSKNFTVSAKAPDKIALKPAELEKLMSVKLNERLEKIRDRFYVGCMVGQRYSDLFKINLSDCYEVKGKMMYRFRSTKTITRTVIPINQQVVDILEKYEGALPPITNQKFNKGLKDLFEFAGFTSMVKVYVEEFGKMTEKAFPMFELISTHTMRRTFITNALAAGLPHTDIMVVTGISSVDTLMKYNRPDLERAALSVGSKSIYGLRKAK